MDTSTYSVLPAMLLYLVIQTIFSISAVASTAPSITNLRATYHDGQTFIVWTDAAAGGAGAKYRYDLYRSTKGPIIDLNQAVLVQKAIYNNSAQLIGPRPFNQATRQNPSLRMSRIRMDGNPLPVWSGLGVYTCKASELAYYAVITRDSVGIEQQSSLSAANSLQEAVREAPEPIAPVLQMASTDLGRNPNCCSITGAERLPLWLRLHGSGGSAGVVGDLLAYWGDSSMGYQDGIQSMFAISEDHSGNAIAAGGVRQLIMAPQDAVWSTDGNYLSETFWYGYKDIPVFAVDRKPHVYPFTQEKLSFIVPWAIQHYNADPNRIYGISQSMGSYGQINWSLRQPGLFAAIFMRVPILGPWLHIPSLIDLTPIGRPITVATTNDTLPDGVTFYNKDTDIALWIAEDCSRELPYMSWASGRNDVSLANHKMWSYAVELANALKVCHYGFSFIWGNGGHDGASANLENRLLKQYQTAFARNLSYPAFSDSSFDENYGDGSYRDGALSGCINCGWKWTVLRDTSNEWSVSFSNSDLADIATTSITLRNTQLFKLAKGVPATWSTNTGQKGTAQADRFGLLTINGIHIKPNETVKLEIVKSH